VLLLLTVSIAWIGIDARPAMSLATCLMLLGLQALITSAVIVSYPVLVVATAVAVLGTWRLRRQSVRAA
jgi:hypothetical protein